MASLVLIDSLWRFVAVCLGPQSGPRQSQGRKETGLTCT